MSKSSITKCHESSRVEISPQPPLVPTVSPKQDRALAVLLAGGSDIDAGKAARVSRETVNRWRHADADFIAELNQRRKQAWERGIAELRSAVPDAVGTLRDLLGSGVADAVRLKAAQAILQVAGIMDAGAKPPDASGDPAQIRKDWKFRQRLDESMDATESLAEELFAAAAYPPA